jgi:hypothetical protein
VGRKVGFIFRAEQISSPVTENSQMPSSKDGDERYSSGLPTPKFAQGTLRLLTSKSRLRILTAVHCHSHIQMGYRRGGRLFTGESSNATYRSSSPTSTPAQCLQSPRFALSGSIRKENIFSVADALRFLSRLIGCSSNINFFCR